MPQTISMVLAAWVTASPKDSGAVCCPDGAALPEGSISPVSQPPSTTASKMHIPARRLPSQLPRVPSRNMGLMVAHITAVRLSGAGDRASSRAPVGEPPHQPSNTSSHRGMAAPMRLTNISDSTM